MEAVKQVTKKKKLQAVGVPARKKQKPHHPPHRSGAPLELPAFQRAEERNNPDLPKKNF